MIQKSPPNDLSTMLRPAMMTAAECAAGRFLRAPDGHDADAGDADADAVDKTLLGDADQGDADAGDKGDADKVADKAKDDAAKAEADKKGDGDKKEPVSAAPEKYDLKAPEGMEFDTETFAAVEPVLRELGLSNENAQKLVSAYAEKAIPAITKRANDAVLLKAAEARKEWADSFEKDPDIGGAKKGDTLSAAARVFDHYGLKKGEGLRLLLDESGLGNHPDMIRVFARIGHDLAEGGFERGDHVPQPKTPEGKMYDPAFQPKT